MWKVHVFEEQLMKAFKQTDETNENFEKTKEMTRNIGEPSKHKNNEMFEAPKEKATPGEGVQTKRSTWLLLSWKGASEKLMWSCGGRVW